MLNGYPQLLPRTSSRQSGRVAARALAIPWASQLGREASRRAALRVAARVASKAVPYVGLVAGAYDLYVLGRDLGWWGAPGPGAPAFMAGDKFVPDLTGWTRVTGPCPTLTPNWAGGIASNNVCTPVGTVNQSQYDNSRGAYGIITSGLGHYTYVYRWFMEPWAGNPGYYRAAPYDSWRKYYGYKVDHPPFEDVFDEVQGPGIRTSGPLMIDVLEPPAIPPALVPPGIAFSPPKTVPWYRAGIVTGGGFTVDAGNVRSNGLSVPSNAPPSIVMTQAGTSTTGAKAYAHTNAPPAPSERERKVRSNNHKNAWVRRALWAALETTEFLDFIDITVASIDHGFAGRPPSSRDEAARIQYVWDNWQYVDLEKWVSGLIVNHFQDALIGGISAGASQQMRAVMAEYVPGRNQVFSLWGQE